MVPACSGWSISIEYLSGQARGGFLIFNCLRLPLDMLDQAIRLCCRIYFYASSLVDCIVLGLPWEILIRLDRKASSLWYASCNGCTTRPRPSKTAPCCMLQFNVMEVQNQYAFWLFSCMQIAMKAQMQVCMLSCSTLHVQRAHRQHWFTHTHTTCSRTPTPLPTLCTLLLREVIQDHSRCWKQNSS